MTGKHFLIGMVGFGMVGLASTACLEGDGTGTASYAVDTDGDGIVNCLDVERVHMCMHYDADPICGEADLNHDGQIDDGDLHGLHQGVSELGHHCDQAPHHGTCGQQCNQYRHRWQWRHCQCLGGEGEAEECTGEPVCEEEQYQWRHQWRWQHCGEGCQGEECCCDEDGGDDPGDDPEDEDPPEDGPEIL